jgi:hypothetical protein
VTKERIKELREITRYANLSDQQADECLTAILRLRSLLRRSADMLDALYLGSGTKHNDACVELYQECEDALK